MDQEERQRKIEAGRAKLAFLRQREAKVKGMYSQKKISKRKSTSDFPAVEMAGAHDSGEPDLGAVIDRQEDPKSAVDLAEQKDSWQTDVMEQSMLGFQAAGGTCQKLEDPDVMVYNGQNKLQSTRDQQRILSQKERIISDMEEKLAVAEKSLSLRDQEVVELRQNTCVLLSKDLGSPDVQLHILMSELEKEREASHQERQRNAELVEVLENEKSELKNQLTSVQAALEQTEMSDIKAQQYKSETQELHAEILQLSSLILDLQEKLAQEEQSCHDLKAKFEAERSNNELQVLEEKRKVALQYLREEHRNSVQKLMEQLVVLLHYSGESCQSGLEGPTEIPSFKVGMNHTAVESASGCEGNLVQEILESSSNENHLMKYLAEAEKWKSSCVEGSNNELSILDQIGNDRFEFDSELELDRSKSVSTVQEDPEQHCDWDVDARSTVPEDGTSTQWQPCGSTSNGLSEGSEAIDLGKVLLMQQCKDLTEQLAKRDEQLQVLQEELRKSAVEVQDAVEKWRCPTERLQSVQCELEAEREQRLRCQEIISHKTYKQDNLKSNQTLSELLELKTLALVSTEKDLNQLQAELEECREKLDTATKERLDLESRLLCLQQNFANVEESLRQMTDEKATREQYLMELEVKARNMENIMGCQGQLRAMTAGVDLESERKKIEEKLEETDCDLETELIGLRKSLKDQDKLQKEALEKLCRLHSEEKLTLEQKHQQVVRDLHVEMEQKLTELKHVMEEEQKRQIVLIKQVHEREHQREWAELALRHEEELSRLQIEISAELQDSLDAAHRAELFQAQAQQALELEALRLSLGEQHAAQLELSQSNFQHDKDAALSELQASLRARWAQESAMLQTRHNRELEATREEHRRELEATREEHRRELDDLKQVWETKLSEQKALMDEQQANKIEVKQLQAECLALKCGPEQQVSQVEGMQTIQQDLAEQELEDQPLACSSCVEVMERLKEGFAQQRKAIQEYNERDLEHLRTYFEQRLRTTEESHQEEITLLQLKLLEEAVEKSPLTTSDTSCISEETTEEAKDALLGKTAASKEDLDALQVQLECRHTQELEVQRTSLVLQHQEELLQVQMNLADRYFQEIQELKSKHTLELEQLRAKLSESHIKEITRIRLQTTQDVAHQVEAELKERARAVVQKHTTYLVQVCLEAIREKYTAAIEEETLLDRKDCAAMLKDATGERHVLEEEQTTQGCLDEEYSLQVQAVIREVQVRFHSELHTAMSVMVNKVKRHIAALLEQVEAKLRTAQDRFQEEQRQLIQQHEDGLDHVREKHREEVEALRSLLEMYVFRLEQLEPRLCVKHQSVSLEADLRSKHQAELESLEAILQETNLVQLEALEAELQAKHSGEKDELEMRHLSNMDTLETTYLAEIQSIRHEKEEMLKEQERRHTAELERLHDERETSLKSAIEQQKRELTQVHVDKFSAMAVELGQAHKEELAAALASQRQTLENQHSASLQELRKLQEVEVEALRTQQQLQLQELNAESSRRLEALRRELEDEASHQKVHFLREMDVLRSQAEEQQVSQLETQSQQLDGDGSETLQKEVELSQLCLQISSLKRALEGKCSEMETLASLLQRRERENQEECHLVTMLRADLTVAAEDRKGLQESKKQLLKVLLEALRTIMATEDRINQRIGSSVNRGNPKSGQMKGDAEDCDSGPDSSLWSTLTDEGLELSQRLTETLLCAPDLEMESEDLVLGACVRLHSAVDKLLEILESDRQQLHHSQRVPLQEQCDHDKDDTTQLALQHQQLLEQLDLEASLKRQLELELHKAEGLVEGYVAEKAALEEAVQQKESHEQMLLEELEAMRVQLRELNEEHVLVLRQRDALSGALGNAEKGLLDEMLRLAQEKLDVQRQAEKDHCVLVSQLRHLESELEDQENRNMELEEERHTHSEDLMQQIQALEKQLRHHRQFIDGQTMEREHEREEFQQEICNLEAQLKRQSRGYAGEDCPGHRIEDFILQVESLQAAIKEKMEDYNALLLTKEKYQHEVAERNEEIDRMAGCIRDLEQALLSSTESNRALGQLEQELQRVKKVELDLLQDREALQQQQYTNRLQISALQSKLDETRHRLPDTGPDPGLREQLEAVRQELQSKEAQVEVLLEQLEQVRSHLALKEEEVFQLKLQLEQLTKQNSICVMQLQCEITSLQEEVSSLRRGGSQHTTALQLPLALLDEKNQEIEHLNQQILHLQREAGMSKDNKVEAELEELRSQVDRLSNDQQRLRHEHEEEEEQLHEVINKLQEELAQLGPNQLEVSDPEEHQSTAPSREHSLGYELQSRLDLAGSEKEALELLLCNQEESFRSQLDVLRKGLKEEQQRLTEVQDEASILKLELSQRQAQVEQLTARQQELEGYQGLESSAVVETLKAEVCSLEAVKEELIIERQTLKQREGWLQEEVERLKQEVASHSTQIQQLSSQLQDREAGYGEAHREVLTCAEETLTKAEGVLRQKEEQLTRLAAEHEALKVELASVKEGLSISTERAEKLVEEGQIKDKALAELEFVNHQLKAELSSLQADLLVQEEELTCQQRALQKVRQQYGLQAVPPFPEEAPALGGLLPLSAEVSACSPERLRHLDYSVDHGAHLSDCSALHCTSLELLSKEHTLPPEPLQTHTELASTCSPGSLSTSHTISAMDSLDAEQVKELVHLEVTPPSSPSSSAASLFAHDWASDGYGSNVSSELRARLHLELEATERLDANFLEYLQQRGMTVADSVDSTAGRDELLSPDMQGLLRKLYEEACRVLALSQRVRPDAAPPSWHGEKRALQEAVLSLRELLCKIAEQKSKAQSGDTDWRMELVQAVSTILSSERDWLRMELKAFMAGHVALDATLLNERVEQLLKQQDDHQRLALEQLLSAERRSLLSELQSLHAQLRIASLQSQEQLQQLQSCLSAAQEEGCQQQHQLQRQVELQEFRLQQEQVLVQELRSCLSVERDIVTQLRAEIDQNHTRFSPIATTQQELTCETCRPRTPQGEEVQHGQALIQELQEEVQHGQALIQELQEEVQREQECSKHRQEQEAKSHEVFQHTLEQERIQSSNLRKELQIEHSRCEALISQEKKLASEALEQLGKARCLCNQLTNALTQEKRVKQDLALKLDEAHSHCTQLTSTLAQEKRVKQDLALKLDEAHSHCTQLTSTLAQEKRVKQDLALKLDEAHSHCTQLTDTLTQEKQAKQDLALKLDKAHSHCTQLTDTLAQEKQVKQDLVLKLDEAHSLCTKLTGALMQEKQDLAMKVEEVRLRDNRFIEELHSRLQQEHCLGEDATSLLENIDQLEPGRQRLLREWQRQKDEHERTRQRLLELEQQQQQDQQHIHRLQQSLLQGAPSHHSGGLQVAQQQLQLARARVTSLLHKASSRGDCGLVQLEDILKELLCTLAHLEQDFEHLSTQGQSVLVDVAAVSWHKERAALLAAVQRAEDELSQAIAESSSSKVQRLYMKYLRAESFRKALVYQKKYLLLLLGGFQDCEQATLSLVTRMGAWPSPAPSRTRPVNRFRTTVRVVIAISRLRFLVRKWHKSVKKGVMHPAVDGRGVTTGTNSRTALLRRPQPAATFSSSPSHNHGCTQKAVVSPLRPPMSSAFSLHSRLLPPESQDTERSLTDYIQHLEAVQQRLGGQKGSPVAVAFPSSPR